MIEIYQWNPAGRCRLVGTYESFYQMFFDYTSVLLANEFGHEHSQKASLVNHFIDGRGYCYSCEEYVKIAYHNGKFISPDNLVGMERAFGYYGETERNKRRHKWGWRYNRWSKPSNHRQWRQAKTFNERKQNVIVDDLEPPIRGKRKPAHLPSWWDDRGRHYEKNWKRNRKTQWKSQK